MELEREITMVDISDIDQEEFPVEKSFLANIKAEGVLVPVVLKTGGVAGYVIIDGRRRITAARLTGREKVPALVIQPTDQEGDIYGVMLNLHRSTNLAYEVKVLKQLIQGGYTQSSIAAMLNITKTKLKKQFHLLNLCDEGMKLFESGRLKTTAAVSMARLPEDKQQVLIAELGEGVLTLKAVQKAWREYTLENFSLDLSEVDEGDHPEGASYQTPDGLGVEFETFVSKISSSRPLPQHVQESVQTLRRYLGNEVDAVPVANNMEEKDIFCFPN